VNWIVSALIVVAASGVTYAFIFWKLYTDQFRINGSWRQFDRENEVAIETLEVESEDLRNQIADRDKTIAALETKVAALEKVVDTVRGAVNP
jgi:predicted  nucleic acid-binding Zn-ribbon protein